MNTAAATVRKTFKYQLEPTPAQAALLETTVWRCRTLYNVALEQRKTWWERGQGKAATSYQLLPAKGRIARPEGRLS